MTLAWAMFQVQVDDMTCHHQGIINHRYVNRGSRSLLPPSPGPAWWTASRMHSGTRSKSSTTLPASILGETYGTSAVLPRSGL